jgi:predicted GNAT family acetyltransferase
MASEVRHNPDASRYEIVQDGRVVGIAEYADRGDVKVFHHTEIDGPLRGGGLGAQLVQAALDDVRAHGGRIIPTCWYVTQFVDEHPDYGDLVASSG